MSAFLPVVVFGLVTAPVASERWRPPELVVKAPPPITEFEALEEIALSYLGRPYVMGGVGSPGFDCSGFVCRVYAESGYAIPRVSRDQAKAGEKVPLDAIAPGDLVFFAEKGRPISHVGLYLGDGELAHASTGQGRVVVARMSARWFSDRFVEARRILTSTTGEPWDPSKSPTPYVAPTEELVEHRGDTLLLPMLRRPARVPAPRYGPDLIGADVTSVAVRSAFVGEDGDLAFTLTPEATLTFESIALRASVAVPVRFPFDARPTVGTFDGFGDYTRFLRHLSLGVEDADLELVLSRFSELSLLSGFVMDQVVPSTEVRAVPGFAVQRTPLSFFGRVRSSWFEAEATIDDVIDPAIFGAGVRVPVQLAPIALGAAVATDQRARVTAGLRAITTAEAQLLGQLVDTREWTLDAHLDVGVMGALDDSGFGTTFSLEGERRFYGATSVTVELEAGYAGSHFVPGLFGPTYAHERRAHLEAMDATAGRPTLGGRTAVRLGKLALEVGYGQSIGANRAAIDRRLQVVLEAQSLSLFGTRLLDLRVAYASRAPFGDEATLDMLQGGARLRLFSWLFAEAYAQKGRAFEAGAGVTVAWLP